MISKLYSKIKNFLKDNIIYILLVLITITISNIPMPYHIETYGGLINIKNKVIVDNEYESMGSYNLTYVSEIKSNIFTVLLSKFNKGWDLYKNENTKEKASDLNLRGELLLYNSFSNATYVAYTYAKEKINIVSSSVYVIYIDKDASTNLKVGDKINSVNGFDISSLSNYLNVVENSKKGDKLKLIVNDNEEKYIVVSEYNGKKNTLIALICNNSYDKNVTFNFNKNESGPSGGFIIALSIYDKLVSADISGGYKISGTGTIDINGLVGEIDGVKYKLKGAVKNKADIFFVPVNNYNEAIKEKNENNYDIDIVKIYKFSDAIKYLESK